MAKRKEEAPVQCGTMIYIGPAVPAFALKKFQVFSGGLSPHARRAAEAVPEVASLIVPVAELESARRKVGASGSAESVIYAAIEKKAAERRVK